MQIQEIKESQNEHRGGRQKGELERYIHAAMAMPLPKVDRSRPRAI